MARFFLIGALLFLCSLAVAQSDMLKYSSEEAYLASMVRSFSKLDFKWTIPGTVQIDMNEGLNFIEEKNYELALTHFTNVLKSDSSFAPARYYRGVCNKMSGRLNSAEKDFKIASKLLPFRPEAFIELGDIYVMRHSFPKANTFYQKASKLDPTSVIPQFKLGSLAFFTGDAKNAKRYFESCNKIKPNFPDAYLAMGILKFRDPSTRSNALPFFSKSIAADSSFAMGYYWRGLSYIILENNSKGRQDWNQAIQLSPSNTFLILMRGYLLIELQEFEDAFKDFRKAMQGSQVDENDAQFTGSQLDKKIDIQNAMGYLIRFGYGLNEESFINLKKGFCLLVTDRHAEAVAAITKAQQIEPSASVLYLKAVAFKLSLNHDSAFVYYAKALALDPNIFDAHKNLAIYESNLKDWKGAYAHLKDMNRIQPGTPLTWRLSGLIKYGLKDYYGAIIDLTKYLKNDTSDAVSLKSRALARFEIADYRGAIEDNNKALVIETQSPQLYMQISECYLYVKDPKSVAVLQEAVTKFPRNFDIKLLLAERLVDFGHIEEAQDILKAFRRNAGNAYFMQNYLLWADYIECKINAKQGKLDKALKQINTIIKTKGESNDYLFLRSQILEQQGNIESAKKDLAKLKANNFKLAGSMFDKYGM